jgi:tripartite motif-containing protein 71
MDPCVPRSPRRACARAALLAALCGCVLASTAPALAAGAPCPGSGEAACPYSSMSVIGQRAEGVLRYPEAVAVDGEGNVYVADQLSYVIQKFSPTGTFLGEWGSYGAGPGQFGPIGALAVDGAGNVYVVDSSHNRIEKFAPSGAFVGAWGKSGTGLGEFHFGSSQNSTQPPGGGIAVAGNHVFVSDSLNNRIERFNLEGGEALQWGSHGSAPGQFADPRGLAASETEVVVADDDNHRIQRFTPEGAWDGEAGEHGRGPGQFSYPYGVALDAAGDVYVADNINARVVKLSPGLAFLGAWGGPGSKPGQLAFPRGIASNPAGDTYVADTANGRVQEFDPEGNLVRTIGTSARGPGQFIAPEGLATDPSGSLFVSDTTDGRIERFSPAGEYLGQWTAAGGHFAGFNAPAGIGIDPRGAVYVADRANGRVVRMWGDGTYLGELGGPLEVGDVSLGSPGSVAVDPASGNTYVADTLHNRVLVFAPDGTLLARWGANEGDGAPGGGQGQFDAPDAVAVGPGGEVFVADTGNNRVVALSSAGAVEATWGVKGSANGHFHEPTGVAVDAAGRVFVVDRENNRVEEFSSEGTFLAKWGVRGVGPGEFAQPTAIAVSCSGAVYVADTHNNRIQVFVPVSPAASGCAAEGSWPPPLDVAPVVNVKLAAANGILSRRALALSVGCQRACKILVTAVVGAPGHRGLALVSAARALAAGRAVRVRLRVGPRTFRGLQRELGRHRRLKARVTIVAAGPTGRRTVLSKSYLLTR